MSFDPTPRERIETVHRDQPNKSSFGATLAAVLSLPLAAVCANFFFGLGSALVIPALAIGAWRAVSAPHRERRAWWFGFTVAVGLCLPLCPAGMRLSSYFAHYIQGLPQRGVFSLPPAIS